MDRGLRELLEQSPVLRVLVPGLLLVFGAFGLLHYATDPSMMPLIPRETIEASHSSDCDSSTAYDSQTATADSTTADATTDARSADASDATDAKPDTTGATAASQDADPQPAGMVASLHASAGGLAAKLTSP
ncbi:MAG: hypothetical protein ACTHLZ_09565 [Tepidisphaeraceae bacterium]